MEIIRLWDSVYVSLVFISIEVTWWVCSSAFAPNLIFTQQQAESRGHMLA